MSSEPAAARRIVVTGMGVVSPLGLTLDEFWKACVGRKSAVRPYAVEGSESIPITCAAPADLFTGDPADHDRGQQQQRRQKYSHPPAHGRSPHTNCVRFSCCSSPQYQESYTQRLKAEETELSVTFPFETAMAPLADQ